MSNLTRLREDKKPSHNPTLAFGCVLCACVQEGTCTCQTYPLPTHLAMQDIFLYFRNNVQIYPYN